MSDFKPWMLTIGMDAERKLSVIWQNDGMDVPAAVTVDESHDTWHEMRRSVRGVLRVLSKIVKEDIEGRDQ